MIYKKDANFPYPVLTNKSTSYKNSNFDLDISLEENTNSYRFNINYYIDSDFINSLLEQEQAKLVLVIQSKDNKFLNVELGETYKEISKSRISLNKRTTLQLLIQSKENLSFANNNDLSEFYDGFKEEINVSKNSILGFSNTVIFEGCASKPLELFEKKLDTTLKSDIKIELGNETIIINYKNEGLQFIDTAKNSTLNNPYIYMGLQKALYRFILNNAEGTEEVYIDEIEEPKNPLDFKLYNLMKKKMVKEVNMDNIDEVIYLISDKILEKYTTVVRGMYQNGN